MGNDSSAREVIKLLSLIVLFCKVGIKADLADLLLRVIVTQAKGGNVPRALINLQANVKVITTNNNRRYLQRWGEGSVMFRLPPRHPPGQLALIL